MFSPTRDQARAFLFDLWEKHGAGTPLSALESMALAVVLEHPEYHAFLADRERYRDRDWRPEAGETNPFLHLQMHLAIEEQASIDQPPGIRAALAQLEQRHGSGHEARHAVMDCLAEAVWQAQRQASVPDQRAYLDCIRRKAGREGENERPGAGPGPGSSKSGRS